MQYISNTLEDKQAMLRAMGVADFEELLKAVPKPLRSFEWKIPAGVSELELVRFFEELGRHNQSLKDSACFLGAGNYDHFVPAIVDRLALRGEFITAYTPYQGEASQGTLQSIYEYQSLLCALTGMDVSNASMYDGASSLAEAALLALRSGDRKKILIPTTVHPEYRAVVKTYVSNLDAEIVEIPRKGATLDSQALTANLDSQVAAVVVQQPNFFGALEDVAAIGEAAKKAGALFIVCVNPISLGVLAAPGEYGADIAVGEGQPLGNAISFGGPHFGFFCAKNELLRKMPGRIAGMSVDKHGRRAFVLTLQAREQHIRREKATSNICTNQALCALKATIYLALLGKQGMRRVGLLNVENAHAAYERLLKIKGVREFSKKPFFNEFALYVDKDESSLKASFRKNRVTGPLALKKFYPDASAYLFAVTENRTLEEIERLARAIEEA